MKLGLYMATQWRQGADLGPELLNLIEQVQFDPADLPRLIDFRGRAS